MSEYLFTSESVSEGHPDKGSDQISDALVDQFLAYDDKAHCAIETFVTTGQVVIMGEVRSSSYIDSFVRRGEIDVTAINAKVIITNKIAKNNRIHILYRKPA